jgi:cystathionine beta-synthase
MIVGSVGTGGTISGIGRKIKEQYPECLMVGADVRGSDMAQPGSLNDHQEPYYEVGGVGHEFSPTMLDYSVIDKWVKVSDEDSFVMARKLIRDEGILCGGSSGTALAAALEAAKDLKENQRCVVVLPDGIKNYMNNFMDDVWMEIKGYSELKNELGHPWWNLKVSDLAIEDINIKSDTMLCRDVDTMMRQNKWNQIGVSDGENILRGIVTPEIILDEILNGNVQSTDPIGKIGFSNVWRVKQDTSLGMVSRMLQNDHYVLVVSDNANSQYYYFFFIIVSIVGFFLFSKIF